MKAITRERLIGAQATGLKLCVDLSMTDSMSDKVTDNKKKHSVKSTGSLTSSATPPFVDRIVVNTTTFYHHCETYGNPVLRICGGCTVLWEPLV